MKYRTLLVSVLTASILAITGCNNDKAQNLTITDKSPELEQVGYSLGYLMASGNKEMCLICTLKPLKRALLMGIVAMRKSVL